MISLTKRLKKRVEWYMECPGVGDFYASGYKGVKTCSACGRASVIKDKTDPRKVGRHNYTVRPQVAYIWLWQSAPQDGDPDQ